LLSIFSLFAVSTAQGAQNRFRQSLFDGFKTFLPVEDRGDTFTRSNG
jgi:hypothetical protein